MPSVLLLLLSRVDECGHESADGDSPSEGGRARAKSCVTG